MAKKISDEKLDLLAKRLLEDFAPDEAMLDEIAGSARLWWQVKRNIEQGKAAERKGLIPPAWWRIFAFGSLAIFLAAGIAGMLWMPGQDNLLKAEILPLEINEGPKQPLISNEVGSHEVSPDAGANLERPLKIGPLLKEKPSSMPMLKAKNEIKPASSHQRPKVATKIGYPALPKQKREAVGAKSGAEETKTDFIALSYGADAESGQILKVKVPSSMMVSLGVAQSVKKASELVDAEVILGDDGLARAIRFIRSN